MFKLRIKVWVNVKLQNFTCAFSIKGVWCYQYVMFAA